jgi:phosphogluconate dehydratase
VISDVTNRIAIRSADQRGTYLERIAAAAENGPARGRLACANLAHGFAASDTRDKSALRRMVKPNIAIVSSYNDMLSAHKPFETYPARLKPCSRQVESPSSPAACQPCATASPRAAPACSCRCSPVT